MMDRGRFNELVERIERRFEGRPEALSRHTWCWMLLGYAVVILLTLLLIGGGLAVLIAGMLLPGPGLLLVVVGGALTTFGVGQVGALVLLDRTTPPGRELESDEAVELQKLIQLVCRQTGAALPDQILLNAEFNAAISQRPRLGIFGWTDSFLMLGVPLLLATSVRELAAIVAHECSHLSRKHGRHGNRIYMLNQSWEKLFFKLQQKSGSGPVRFAGALLFRFLNWYWPRFHARAFVLSRQHEYIADQAAVEATSPDDAAAALWRIECTGYMLEQKFWKELWDLTSQTPQPPPDLCDRLQQAFQQAPESQNASRWCDLALQRVANDEDTHPSLSDRLQAFGVDPEQKRIDGFPQAPELSAADGLLGMDLAIIKADINDQWRNSVMAIWRERHRRICAIQKLAGADSAEAPSESQDPAKIWNQIRAVLDTRGPEHAEALLRRLLSIDPEHVGATFVLGQLRLSQGHDDGEDLLQHVVSQRTIEWTGPAGAVLERHLAVTGRKEAVRVLRKQLDAFEKDHAAAELERTKIRRGDAFVPHELTEHELKQLQNALLNHKRCSVAWLVQKQLQHFSDNRLFVLCVDAGEESGRQRNEYNDRMLTAMMLSIELPGRLFVIHSTGEFRDVASRIRRQADSLVFQRSELSPESESAAI